MDFSREELIGAFSLDGINKANSIFDVRTGDPKFFTDPKAISINSHYVRTLPIDELIPYVRAEMEKAGIWDPDFESSRKEWFSHTLGLIRERYNFTTDFATLGRPFFSDAFTMEQDAVNKNILKHEGLKTWFQVLADSFESLADFENAAIEKVIRDMAEKENIKAGILINGIRTAVTGQAVGPGIFELLDALGRDRVVRRLRKAVELFG